jgi:hypothetical protein
MERTEVLELMSTLKLFGMRAAYDEVMATAIKRRHEPPQVVGDLLGAEIAEKQARSIKYQLTIAKLPLAKDIDNFDFTGTPVNETLIRDQARRFALSEWMGVGDTGGLCRRAWFACWDCGGYFDCGFSVQLPALMRAAGAARVLGLVGEGRRHGELDAAHADAPSAAIFNSLRRIVAHVAWANLVCLRAIRRTAQMRT